MIISTLYSLSPCPLNSLPQTLTFNIVLVRTEMILATSLWLSVLEHAGHAHSSCVRTDGLREKRACLFMTVSQGLDEYLLKVEWGSLMVQMVKNLPANTGDQGSIPGSRESPGRGHDNPLWYSCLKNSTDRGPWRATVHGITVGHN